MAKKILLALLFCAMHMACSPVFAANDTAFRADVCTAPAPDSFRITSIGGDFISLAWVPAWVGAEHTLSVLENDGVGGWITFDTLHNVPGSSQTVEGLEPGMEYRFILATNCSTGEPSELVKIIDGITLIVDLTIIGRNPNTPVAVDCGSIPLNSNWVGFKVEQISAGISIANFFELVVDGNNTSSNFFSKVQIRRVYRDHPLVAVNPDNQWPTCDDPLLIDVGASFRMARLLGNGPNMELIGWIDLYQNSGSSISICPDYNHPDLPWKNTYKFTALVAPKASAMPGCGNRSGTKTKAYAEIKAQSPFDQTLHVFFPTSFPDSHKTCFRLLNTQGQTVWLKQMDGGTNEVELPTGSIIPGFYILQIETKDVTHSLKVIKS